MVEEVVSSREAEEVVAGVVVIEVAAAVVIITAGLVSHKAMATIRVPQAIQVWARVMVDMVAARHRQTTALAVSLIAIMVRQELMVRPNRAAGHHKPSNHSNMDNMGSRDSQRKAGVVTFNSLIACLDHSLCTCI